MSTKEKLDKVILDLKQPIITLLTNDPIDLEVKASIEGIENYVRLKNPRRPETEENAKNVRRIGTGNMMLVLILIYNNYITEDSVVDFAFVYSNGFIPMLNKFVEEGFLEKAPERIRKTWKVIDGGKTITK